ncbi:heterokaryon incompatibility protein-domain-containing protein [Apiosordaria backusii]|uniref:Heterokaryon incompatibility protein-domain-containing protein n=1 Tax=Apiosordaria backusii TaxID=314023 RepID=A0AA40EZT4_9PEZI|nr:heterokaryon incompatibility protein-domain-containing protein [Apiosordaria backusii]
MSHRNASFPYPPLETEKDALRILTIEPGDFADTLVCTLDPFFFSDKPKQRVFDKPPPPAKNNVLPITHIDPDKHGPISPIIVNDHPFLIRHNLHLALLHLRSSTHPISIWADAICINQLDTAERNRQVSLMSFIYTRASHVVVWLGTKNHTMNQRPNTSSPGPALFRSMSLEWKAGQTQHLAAGLIPQTTTTPGHGHGHGQARTTKIRYSPKPPQGTLMRLAESTYWTRLWVVQEVCLSRSLLVVYGSNIWAYEEFRQWVQVSNGGITGGGGGQRLPPPHPQVESEPVATILAPMRRLLETRDRRHTSVMTLESLVERFAGNECSELRDRVYGLLGCANDALTTSEDHTSTEQRLGRLSIGQQTQRGVWPRPRGTGGLLRVDYSRSFYDLWRSVVGFIYHCTESTPGKTRLDYLKGEERRITIVRTAGIIQRALGQKLDEELPTPGRPPRDHESIRVVGYIAGEIIQLGPGYSDLVGSYRAQQEWTACWDEFYSSEELSTLRQIDEEYVVKILDYEEQDLDRIRNIPDPFVIGSRVPVGRIAEKVDGLATTSEPTRSNTDLSHSISSEQESFYVTQDEEGSHVNKDARICLGTGHLIGLVPQQPRSLSINPPNQGSGQMFMLVGRADVAGITDMSDKTPDEMTATPELDAHFERCAAMVAPGGDDAPSSRPVGYGEGCSQKELGAIYVDLGLRTLQMITANVEV